MTAKKLNTWSEALRFSANNEAARIILANPDKYPGIMQIWARLYRKLTTVEQEYKTQGLPRSSDKP